METLLQDLRFALRSLRRSPGFTAVAVLTLAVGIGAATAVFSVVDASMLRPLPFPAPDRLVHVRETTPEGADFTVSAPNYLRFRESNRSFQEMAAYRSAALNLTGAGDPVRLEAAAVTHTLFPLLGATPVLGRGFTADEDRPGGDTDVVVLSHALWETRFGADPAVVGRRIALDGRPRTVVGVMPAGVELPRAELWTPLVPDAHADVDDHWLDVVGRLRPGVTPEQAHADLAAVSRRIGTENPSVAGWGVRVETFSDWLVGPRFRRTMLVMLGAVGLLLALACANLANLLLARASNRQTEMGVRAALGAARGRIVRQLLTESALLGLLASAAGVVGAAWAVRALQALRPAGIPQLDQVSVDVRVLAFALGLGMLTCLGFGLAPALRTTRSELTEPLRGGGRAGTRRGEGRLRDALVVSQIALAMVLLTSAGLLIRSLVQLQRVDPGFRPADVLAVSLQLPDAGYAESWRKVAFFREATRRIERLPGVVSAGATAVDPFSGFGLVNNVTPAERAAETGPGGYLQAGWRIATPGFFRTAGIPLLRGRVFAADEPQDGPRLVVVTESLARRLWPGGEPIGKGLYWGGTDGTPLTVVGVVGDYRDVDLAAGSPPLIFLPYDQLPWPAMTLLVRTRPDAASVAGEVRRQIRSIDPNLPIPEIRPLRRNLARAVAEPRFRASLLGLFSAAALVIAASGIYGVMSFTVARRTREIGVRLALGARPGAARRLLLRHGARLALTGIALGAFGAWTLSRFLESLLYETAATDALTFASTATLLGSIALLAVLIPARRATRVDPMVALRAE
jgi:predicted permease